MTRLAVEMVAARAHVSRYPGLILKLGVAILFAVLMTACGTLFPETFRVDPGAVREMRTIGKVLSEAALEGSWDMKTEITQVLLIDLGASGPTDSVRVARDRLRKLGWIVSIDSTGSTVEAVAMESSKWDNVELFVAGLHDFDSPDGVDPDEIEAVRKATAQSPTGSLVVLEASRTDT